MVHIAHEEGFAVMSHTNGDYGVQAAIEAGADSVEHGNYISEETISMLADSNTVWVPTLVTVRNLMGSGRYDSQILARIAAQGEENLQPGLSGRRESALGSDGGLIWFRMDGELWTNNMHFWISLELWRR